MDQGARDNFSSEEGLKAFKTRRKALHPDKKGSTQSFQTLMQCHKTSRRASDANMSYT